MIVVSKPRHSLAKVGCLQLLSELFSQVSIAPEVGQEVMGHIDRQILNRSLAALNLPSL